MRTSTKNKATEKIDAFVSINEMLCYLAAVRGDEVVQIYKERSTTFRGLNAMASRVANGLVAQGTMPGMRIAVLAKNSDRQCELLFGTAKTRSVLVFINWRLAPQEIAYVLDNSQARLLFVESGFENVARRAVGALKAELRIIVLDDD